MRYVGLIISYVGLGFASLSITDYEPNISHVGLAESDHHKFKSCPVVIDIFTMRIMDRKATFPHYLLHFTKDTWQLKENLPNISVCEEVYFGTRRCCTVQDDREAHLDDFICGDKIKIETRDIVSSNDNEVLADDEFSWQGEVLAPSYSERPFVPSFRQKDDLGAQTSEDVHDEDRKAVKLEGIEDTSHEAGMGNVKLKSQGVVVQKGNAIRDWHQQHRLHQRELQLERWQQLQQEERRQDQLFSCRYCKASFKNRAYLKHMNVCGPYRCIPCNRRFLHEFDVNIHKKSLKHKKNCGILAPKPNITCPTCGREFRGKDKLPANHPCVRYNIDKASLSTSSPSSASCKTSADPVILPKIACERCHKAFTPTRFAYHNCYDSKTKTYFCLRCRKAFGSRILCQLHICEGPNKGKGEKKKN